MHVAFEQGVAKIQRNRIHSMTGIGEFACTNLPLRQNSAVSVPETSEEVERSSSAIESVAKKA